MLKATNVLSLPRHKRATSRRGTEIDPEIKCNTVSIQIWHRSYAFKNGPFKIGQRVRSAVDAIEVAICRHDRCGRGECVPYPRYGESLEAIVAQIRQLPVGVTRADLTNLLRSGPARNALDCALWDLEAKHAGRRVWELAELNAPGPVDTMVSISNGTAAEMAEEADRHSRKHRQLKLFLTNPDVLSMVSAIHEAAPNCDLIIDAAESWDIETYVTLAPKLARMNVVLIEQPLPAGKDSALAGIGHPVPICADESCRGIFAVSRLKERYDFINIKLDNAGGLTAALALREAARKEGLGIMIGSTIGSSLAIAPAVLLAQDAEFIDLDGPLLLEEEHEAALLYEGGSVHPARVMLWG